MDVSTKDSVEQDPKFKARLKILDSLDSWHWTARNLLNYLDSRDQYEMTDTICELLQDDPGTQE